MRKIKLFTIALTALTLCACAQKNEPVITPATATVVPTAMPTVEVTVVPTVTATVVPTVETTPTVEVTPTMEVVPTPTVEVTPTIEVVPTATPVPTVAPTATLVPIATPVPTATPAPTKKPTPTATPVAPTKKPTPTVTPVPTKKPTPTPVVKRDDIPEVVYQMVADYKAWEAGEGEYKSSEDYGVYLDYEAYPFGSSAGAEYAYRLKQIGFTMKEDITTWPEEITDVLHSMCIYGSIERALAAEKAGDIWEEQEYPRVKVIGGEGEEPLILTEDENRKIVQFIYETNRLKATLPNDEEFVEFYYDITKTAAEAEELIKRCAAPVPYEVDYWAQKYARQRAYMCIDEFKHIGQNGGGSEAITQYGADGFIAADAFWNSIAHKGFIEGFGAYEGGTLQGVAFAVNANGLKTTCSVNNGKESSFTWAYNNEYMTAWREAHPELKGIAY